MPEDKAEKPEKPDDSAGTERSRTAEEAGDQVEYETVPREGLEEQKKALPALKVCPEEDKGLKGKLKKKDAEIKALKKENDELKDKFLRSLAEMENMRKRLEREKTEYQQYALSDVLNELLVIVDNFERALLSRDQTDGKSFLEGVEMIYRQTLELLKKRGVTPIEIKDKKFDPNVHHAVFTEESEEVKEAEVAAELQRGYRLHGRLLRPSLVTVRVPKTKDES